MFTKWIRGAIFVKDVLRFQSAGITRDDASQLWGFARCCPEAGLLVISSRYQCDVLKGKDLGQYRYERIVRSLAKENGVSETEVQDWLGRRRRDVPLVGNS